MSRGFVALALAGLLLMLAGLFLAAWRGQDSDGRWRSGAWRYWALALGGFLLMAGGLTLAGNEGSGLHFPSHRWSRQGE